jgi:uridine kinase
VKAKNGETVFVGVAGVQGSGKSHFCETLQELLQDEYDIEIITLAASGYLYSLD